MKKSHSVLSASLVLGLSVAGCVGGDAAPRKVSPACTTGKCDGLGAHPVVVSCKQDGDEVECTSPLKALLPVDGSVALSDGKDYQTISDSHSVRVKVGTSVKARLTLVNGEQDGLFHDVKDSSFLGALELPFVANGDRAIELPYDLWTITIESPAAHFMGRLDPQTISVAPWRRLGDGPSEMTRGGAPLPHVDRTTETFFVLVNRDATSVTGNAVICGGTPTRCTQNVPFTLDGSGYYVLDFDSGALVHKDSAPPANDPPANDPPANDPPANDPPANDPSDPDPSCGGQDQSGCGSEQDTCDAGLTYQNGTCQPLP